MGKVRVSNTNKPPSARLLMVTLVLGLLAAGPLMGQGNGPPIDVLSFGCNDRLEGKLSEEGGVDWYYADVQWQGLLIVGASTNGTALQEPLIGLFEPSNGAVKADLAGITISKQTPNRLVLAVSKPGPIFFRVSAQDPRAALHKYTLTSLLIESSNKDGDPVEDPEEDPDEDEGEIEPLMARLPGNGDDHGDIANSATPLVFNENVAGELVNGVAADLDYLTFSIADQQTVVIETQGETDTYGGLYDDNDFRLAANDNGGSDGNFRIVKTLVAGRYFVRVEGWGAAQGAYSLRIEFVN